jgi:hypothetical protein
VRRGASGTAAYHLQLTVAAVARPVRSSVGALGVLAAERSWLLLAQTAPARRSVQPASSGRPSSPRPAMPGRRPRRRSPVGVHHALSTHPVSSSGIRQSGPSGVRPVRCPARPVSGPSGVSRPVSGHLGSSSGVRRSGRLVSPVQRPALRCPPLRCPPLRCPACLVSAPSVRTRPSPPTSGGGVGDQAGAAGHPSPQEPVEVLVGCRAVERLGRRPSRPGGRATLPGSRVGPWGVAGGLAGLGAAAARTRCATRQARPACGAPLAGGAGWPRQPGGCRSWAGWATTVRGRRGACRPGGRAPEGPMGVPADRRAAPTRPRLAAELLARRRQRCDLREWVVGLPGLEPGTSSLSAKCR